MCESILNGLEEHYQEAFYQAGKAGKEYLYSENDRCIMLIMNMENHLKDDELFALMEAKLDEWRKIHFSSVSSNKLFLVILCSHFSLL